MTKSGMCHRLVIPIVALSLTFGLAGCSQTEPPQLYDKCFLYDDVYGNAYFVSASSSGTIDFELLTEDVEIHRLSFHYRSWDKGLGPDRFLALVHKGEKKTSSFVTGYSSLYGCVSLSSPQDALDFFRFFSDLWVYRYIPMTEVGIYPDPELTEEEGICLQRVPLDIWNQAGLALPSAERKGDYYLVTRYVVDNFADHTSMDLHKVVDKINKNGWSYERVSDELITPAPDFVKGVYFPSYMFDLRGLKISKVGKLPHGRFV